jgi:hypothetical protein
MAYIEKIAGALNIAPYLLFYDSSQPSTGREQLLTIQKDAFTRALVNDVTERIRVLTEQYL